MPSSTSGKKQSEELHTSPPQTTGESLPTAPSKKTAWGNRDWGNKKGKVVPAQSTKVHVAPAPEAATSNTEDEQGRGNANVNEVVVHETVSAPAKSHSENNSDNDEAPEISLNAAAVDVTTTSAPKSVLKSALKSAPKSDSKSGHQRRERVLPPPASGDLAPVVNKASGTASDEILRWHAPLSALSSRSASSVPDDNDIPRSDSDDSEYDAEAETLISKIAGWSNSGAVPSSGTVKITRHVEEEEGGAIEIDIEGRPCTLLYRGKISNLSLE